LKESRGFRAILIVLALPLMVFGGWRLVDPIGFYAFSGLELSDDAGLLSEVRGTGGIIMVSGLVVGLGALRHAWMRTSAVLWSSRRWEWRVCWACAEVIQGMAIELVCGGPALFAFFKYDDGALSSK
jgi:hypothetical protein